MDALDLARWQFGVTTVYHFLFVPLTIGLGVFVAGLQTAWHLTGKTHYLILTKFFGKLFLINFAMGVVTGIFQEFQFGMNWSEYSTFVGDVFGAPLALEALLAFFLESTFLGLWIFGWDKLPRGLHLATLWAAVIGSNLSAYFILCANAWMKHPVGYEVIDGRARMTDIWAVLSNPTATAQVPHVVAASFVVAGIFVLAVCGYRILRERHSSGIQGDPAMWQSCLRGALVMTAIAGIVVATSGDTSARLLSEQQPMKLAAAEGLRHDQAAAPMTLVPGVKVPGLLSLLSAHDANATVQGIDDIQQRYEQRFGPGDYTPDLPVVFWSFRVMVGLGVSAVALAMLGLWLTRRGAPRNEPRTGRRTGPRAGPRAGPHARPKRRHRPVPSWFARLCLLALPLPTLAMTAGWLLSEMGRQPWTVTGELLTAASVSPGVTLTDVAISLTVLTLLYLALALAQGVLFVRHIKASPEPEPALPGGGETDSHTDGARLTPTLMY